MSSSTAPERMPEPALLHLSAARIEFALCHRWRLIDSARVRRARNRPGYEVVIGLDRRIVMARAEQQGLLDDSTKAAAENPRVLAAMAQCIAAVNTTLPESETIAAWAILS